LIGHYGYLGDALKQGHDTGRAKKVDKLVKLQAY
jgi:hypothetical protein